jgi:ABC-type transport system substrate-binding protein
MGLAHAAMRPHYGGTLRVAINQTLSSLDPADASNLGEETGIAHVAPLIFDTLTTVDHRGEIQPRLAFAWKSDQSAQRWEIDLRPGVTFSDGTPMTAAEVAESLQVANPRWKISAAAASVTIETDTGNTELPAELALPQNSIVLRGADKLTGTGPFMVRQWTAGKTLVLSAREDYWAGRPFVDSVEITVADSPRDALLSFDLGRVDAIEIPPEQAGSTGIENGAVASSAPDVLLALVFSGDPASPEEEKLRQALSISIDRTLLNSVVLRGAGEPAGGLLPDWMTGYEFLFPASPNLSRARQAHSGIRQALPWKLGYDVNDPVARVVSERIALNAQDAGLNVQPTAGNRMDMKLVRMQLRSCDARLALSQLALELHLAPPNFHGGSAEDLYAAEDMLLQSKRVIPLLYLRNAVGLATGVRDWSEGQDGRWGLANVWLSTEKP